MALYTVFAPPPKPGAAAPDPLGFVFVKDGFCWPALFVPELWLLFRRMWLVFLIYLAASAAISIIGTKVGGPLPWVTLALVHLLFALEANALRRWKLSGLGYALVGVAEGHRGDAEMRFFSQWQQPAPPAAPAEPSAEAPPVQATAPAMPEAGTPAPAAVSAESGTVIGLFPAPGGTS
jgi:hypothetical protein